MLRRTVVTAISVALVLVFVLGCSSSAPASSPSPSSSPPPSSPATSASSQPQASPKPSESPKAPPPPATVRVGLINSATDAPTLIAMEKGYFKEQGITIQPEIFDSASRMIPPLASGQLDVGAGGVSAGLFNSIVSGVPVKAVATKGDLLKGAGALMVKKEMLDSGRLKDYKDLKGMKIAINASKNTTHFNISQAIRKGGLTDDDVTLNEIPFPQIVTALSNGSIDVGWLIEPYITIAKEQGMVIWHLGEDYLEYAGGSLVLLYAPHFWQKQDEVGKRFMVAYVKGVRDYIDAMWKKKANREDVIQILMQKTPMKDRALYDKMTPITYHQDALVDRKAIAANQDWYLERGYQTQKVDLNTVIDDSYTDYALKILGPYKE